MSICHIKFSLWLAKKASYLTSVFRWKKTNFTDVISENKQADSHNFKTYTYFNLLKIWLSLAFKAEQR